MNDKVENTDTLESISRKPLKTAVSCPISGETLDERAVRLVAGITVILLVSYFTFGFSWIPLFLLIDFSMRGVFSRKWAPLALIARKVVSLLDPRKKKKINAGPKIFAARLGIAFSAILFVLQLGGSGASIFSTIVIAMFITAAFLESAFAFCLGCHIYHFLQKFKKPCEFSDGGGI